MEVRRILTQCRGPYRSYSSDDLSEAFKAVVEKGCSVEKAARTHGVPITTLKDRVKGRVAIDNIKSGPQPIFDSDQEQLLAKHLTTMAEVGYGYSRQETINLATDYAIHLGLRDKNHPLSLQWLYSFLSRWPDLKVKKPRSLDIYRAKSATESAIGRYFSELKTILDKFHLADKPERIFNIDEKDLRLEHKPPKIVASKAYKAQAVTAGKSKTVTLIGCVNAVGQQVPPYFIFPGQRMMDCLLDGATAGVTGTVTQSGWSNTAIFERYMMEHLTKFLPVRDENNQVLVLYDGHKSHVSLPLIQWAKTNHVILFVLPPHCSHLLQPLDVSCFGPFEMAWNAASHKHLRDSGGAVLTRYDVCSIACKVYTATLTPSNIQAAFRRCGIFPFDSTVVAPSLLAPSTSFQRNEEQEKEMLDKNKSPAVTLVSEREFLERRGGKILENVKVATVRKTLSKVVGGKAITEDTIVKAITEHKASQAQKRKPPTEKATNSQKEAKKFKTPYKESKEPTPGTSGTVNMLVKPISQKAKKLPPVEDYDSDEDAVEEAEKCVVCHRFSPEDLSSKPHLKLLSWGCCDKCSGWVHLSFCTQEKILRRGDSFLCPGCKSTK